MMEFPGIHDKIYIIKNKMFCNMSLKTMRYEGGKFMALKLCPKCGKEIDDKSKECIYCGFSVSETSGEADKEFEEKPVLDGDGDENKNPDEDIHNCTDNKKSNNKNKIIIGIAAASVIVIAFVVFFATSNLRAYSKAENLLADKEYEKAIHAFEKLDGYKNSDEMIEKCHLDWGKDLIEEGQYTEALEKLQAAGSGKDVEAATQECIYKQSVLYMEYDQYEEAIKNLEMIEDYEDSKELLGECKYIIGKGLYEKKDYENALKYLDKLKYKDSEAMVENIKNNPYSINKFIERYNAMADILNETKGAGVKKLDVNNVSDNKIETGTEAVLKFNSSSDEDIDCKYEITSFMWSKKGWIFVDENLLTAEWYCSVAGFVPDSNYDSVGDILTSVTNGSENSLYASAKFGDSNYTISKSKKVITLAGQRME